MTSSKGLPTSTQTVVIGGGVIGLSIAYNLCLQGATDVVVLEASYLAYGASGRNGGGIRQQWGTELNTRLMQESVSFCKSFATELGINIWFRQGGYLFLARQESQVARLEKTTEIQNRCGLPTRILGTREVASLVPHLSTDGVLAACYNPTDGILFPWPFLWGYAERSKQMGASIHTHTPVTGIARDGKGFIVQTARGNVKAERVVNAAGAWSPAIAAMLDVDLPTHPIRHEICCSEPLKPFLGPMVSDLGLGLYFSQSMRGELVGGMSLDNEPHTTEMKSSLRFLQHYAHRLVELMPILGDVKVLRQWSGPYEKSPDGHPVLGAPAAVPGFYQACGFVGHGFMMAPALGKHYAEFMLGKASHPLFQTFSIDRFSGDGNRTALEVEDFNIG